ARSSEANTPSSSPLTFPRTLPLGHCRASTRQSILFARCSYEERWTRGSSPRVTVALRVRAERPCQQRFDRLVHARPAGENPGNRGCDRHVDVLFLRQLDPPRRGEDAFGQHAAPPPPI